MTTTTDAIRLDHVAERQALSLEVRSDGVAVITYDVPGEAVNTLQATFAKDFEAVIGAIARDKAVRAAILVSGKPDTWIAGADLEMIQNVSTAAAARAVVRAGHQAIERLAKSSKPIVAAVHGAALGGGFEVALACQGRVLSDDKKTVLGLPEVQLGLLPGMNGLSRLAEMAGLEVALEHGLTGKTLHRAKARALGIADDLVPAAILREAAAGLALALAEGRAPARRKKLPASQAIASALLEKNAVGRAVMFRKARRELLKKTGGHYPAPERILQVLEVWAKRGFDAARDAEADAFGELAVSDVARRLMEIFFATTALKKDSGVDDASVKPRNLDGSVEKIAVLGAGLMGAGIAYVTLNGGIAVRLKDRDDAALGKGLKYVSDIFDERVKKRQLTRVERDQYLAKLTAATDYSGLKGADIVIEAVFEDIEIKHRVLREVEGHARDGFIFASNTSSIPVTKIAEAARHPENVVGMHYFSPVHRMMLLEVITTTHTSPEVVATAVAVGKKQGKTVIVVRDGAGFYTSRILGPYINEAAWLLTEGVAIETIDDALTAWGWPVGPLTLIDEVGIDVAAHVGATLVAAFGARFEPPPALGKLEADDRKGKKNERGLYLYGESAKKRGPFGASSEKRKRADASVYPLLGLPLPDPSGKSPVPIEDVQMRCSLQLINEAMHCHGEGILRSARDGDIGAIFGLGFPPFRGGPFRFVDSIGASEALRRIEGYAQRFGERWTPAPVLVELAKSGKRFHA
jgi:3-hydroxyacyl-CoA dehydrogenase / enoyl-CoA hydratase / 3-hydroxybutyryl-CoA epimerase